MPDIDPMYTYVDAQVEDLEHQIKLLTGKVNRLAKAHDAVAIQQTEALLGLERWVASMKINTDTNSFGQYLKKITNGSNLRTQLISEAASAKTAIRTSTTPRTIVVEFYKRWIKILQEKGIEGIEF